MQIHLNVPADIDDRLDRARRSSAFDRVPSKQALVRQFIEEGLARLESSPRTDAAAGEKGATTTNPEGDQRR
jgi:hypothetical protein